ncbi:MAG: molybdopterin-dependent oxidoreductase [Acidobacteriota bacterium]|nr:molybdopterin-dependent oxidoreductase [Acidobacteriota bacterium]
MNEQEKKSSGIESEVLVEKVREIESAKPFDKIEEKENTARILNEKRKLSVPMSDKEAQKLMGKHSRRSFPFVGAAAIAGYLGYRYLPLPDKEEIFKRAFRFNENVSQLTFEHTDLAPEFPRELAGARANGDIGLGEDFDAEDWDLQVVGAANAESYPQFFPDIAFGGEDNAPRKMDEPPAPNVPVAGLLISLDEIKALPRVEMTTELKCIEGWSIICNWTGARFSDFAAKFAPPANTKYVSLVTPDRGYYVGWDMPSILHPQTLLAYQMNGAPLTSIHGAPLRLVTTTKYGIKQIKRIGRIEYTNERPADYWAERGYDWYSGH